MEIYKLGDAVPAETSRLTKKHNCDIIQSEASEDAGAFGGQTLAITDMKQGVKNAERVNIFIDGRFAFSLDVAQVVDYKLKIGKVLTEEELAELRKASEFGIAYQRALEWALVRPRSVKELKDYLKRREIQSEAKERKQEWQREREAADLRASGDERGVERMARKNARVKASLEKREKYDFNDLIVERLCGRGYVDDAKFAQYYVENRFVKKGISHKRLKMELAKKGIAKEIIDEVLDARNDEEEILKIIAKKYGKYDDDKLIQYLCRQGFDYQLVQSLVRDYEKD